MADSDFVPVFERISNYLRNNRRSQPIRKFLAPIASRLWSRNTAENLPRATLLRIFTALSLTPIAASFAARAYPDWLESLKGDFGAGESVIRCSTRKRLGTAMAWRQGQSYSEDLRGRVLAAVDGGMSARAAAKLFQVSVSYIYKGSVALSGVL